MFDRVWFPCKPQLPFGPIQAYDYGNGLKLARSYDQDYRQIEQTIPGILQSSYQHDPVGNITDWFDLLNTGRDQQFGYDQLDRLINASGAYGALGYTYDATGNRLSLSDGASSQTYTYASGSHRLLEILGGTTDTRDYDSAGNTLQSLIGSYSYDASNRMAGFTKRGLTAAYVYNGQGERIRKTVNGVTTRYRYGEGGQLLGEYDQSGEAIREYAYLSGQPIAMLTKDLETQAETAYYLHTDHLGAVVKATDSGQALVWDAQRKPFGERTVVTAQVEMPLGFPGQYYDQESNNYYNYFRDYDPTTGRYLQSDPIGLYGGINTYAYVYGNPIGLVDPFGLFNPAKGASALGNAVIGGFSGGSGGVKIAIAAGLSPASVSGVGALPPVALFGWGMWNIKSAMAAWKRSQQQWHEALCEDSSQATWKNLYGMLPGGTNYDDPGEYTGPIDYIQNRGWWEFFSEFGYL